MKLLAAALLMTLALTASAARDLRGLEVAQPPADANATMEPRAFVEDFLEDPAAYFESAGEVSGGVFAGVRRGGYEAAMYPHRIPSVSQLRPLPSLPAASRGRHCRPVGR